LRRNAFATGFCTLRGRLCWFVPAPAVRLAEKACQLSVDYEKMIPCSPTSLFREALFVAPSSSCPHYLKLNTFLLKEARPASPARLNAGVF
jgi:hypothetical protein